MTALMSQVTCDLCYEKIDESKWKEQIISTNRVLKCKTYESIIATKFFEMIFEARPEKKKIFDLEKKITQFLAHILFNKTTKGEI